MNIFSRKLKRNGARHRNTAAGRATSISVAAIASAGSSRSGKPLGQASSPSSTNMHDLREPGRGVEKRDDRDCARRVARLPTTSPAR